MKYRFLLLSCFLYSLMGLAQKRPVDYVDVFTGTSNSRAMLGPYAGVPYGMVQLGPDNQDEGWMGGYEYSLSNVLGFSHIHAWSMGGLMITPHNQDFTIDKGRVSSPYKGAGASIHSRISKKTECGAPGYYSCFLYDAGCKAELTASARCGFHKYTFNKEHDESRFLISLNYPTEYKLNLKEGYIKKVSDSTIEGYASIECGYSDYKLNFYIEFSKPFLSVGGWENSDVKHDIDAILGKGDVGAIVTFNVKENEAIMMKVGLSLVDIQGAKRNLSEEMDLFGWDFNKARKSAEDQWNNLLSRIKVEGSEKNKRKFYTNFYRSFSKQRWNDVDGRYVDPFEQIQKLTDATDIYGGDALWNSFWNYNTILSLIAPDIMNNWVKTQLELYDKTGWTSNGPTGVELTGIMEVTHEIAMMVSAYQKGIRNYDTKKLYDAVLHNSMEQGRRLPGTGLAGMERLDIYNRLGYVPYEIDAASRTLDYAYTDFCAAQLAKIMGKKKDYKFLLERSNNWKNQFHPLYKWQVPKDSLGNWLSDYNPFSGKHWIEGNGWQYTWYVPHDVDGLIHMMGKDLFNSRLEEGFEKSIKHNFAAHVFDRHQDKAYEYYVNHGNEVNMQAAYLFNYSGKPWLTQMYTRMILEKYYGDTPFHGWEGDEDEGQMSGWFVISSMGLFEMNGGVMDKPTFDLTSPLFDKITIELSPQYYSGKEFVIETVNNSPDNVYIQKAYLNGKELIVPKLAFEDVIKGGNLVLYMGDKPNFNWGIDK